MSLSVNELREQHERWFRINGALQEQVAPLRPLRFTKPVHKLVYSWVPQSAAKPVRGAPAPIAADPDRPSTYHGHACRICGSSRRYISNRSCVPCTLRRTNASRARKVAKRLAGKK